jgi:DNA-binding beta-propeller fold protein YncE
LSACAAIGIAFSVSAQQMEKDLTAKARIFAEAGAGVRGVTRDSAGRYYVLTAPGPALIVFDAAGKRTGQVPPDTRGSSAAKQAAIRFGLSLDVSPSGHVFVADRASNSIRIYKPDGGLLIAFPVEAPLSVVSLGGDEVAVSSMKAPRLVTVYDLRGKVLREFGAPADLVERAELNRYLNAGLLASDPDGNLYYGFSFMPEPTARKYDRYGYAAYEISIDSLDFYPAAQAARREIHKEEAGGTPAVKPIVTAIAVDPATQEVWMASGGVLLHFDRQGNRRGTYRAFTPEGGHLAITSILVEADRLLLADDPLGIYEFARPDKIDP